MSVGENVFEDVIKQLLRLDKLGKGLLDNDLDLTTKISALVLLLEEKGFITTGEFDKKYDELNAYVEQQAKAVKATAKQKPDGFSQ